MSGFNFNTKGGFGAMLANTQARQINEANERPPKAPTNLTKIGLRQEAKFELLGSKVNGRWTGVETGPGVSGKPYYNAWIHFPEFGKKAWQNVGNPFDSEQKAIEFIKQYKAR